MNKKKLGKVTGVAAASFLIAGTTALTAFAAMPSGTAVIGEKAYDLNYVNDPANEAEIVAAMQKANFKVYVKDFAGNWIVNETESALTDLSVLPVVEYKNAEGKVVKYDAKDGDIITDELKVTGVSAINPTTLTVSGEGLNKLKVDDLSIDGNKVVAVTPAADNKTANVTLEGQLPPDKETTIKITVGAEVKEFKVTFGYKITSVVANEVTFDDDRAGQKVTFKVNGESKDADIDYLTLAGYSVNFVAINKDTGAAAAIFAGATSTSTTGILDTSLSAFVDKNIEIEVQLSKSGEALIADKATVRFANLDAAATTVESVIFAIDKDTDGVAYNANGSTSLAGTDFALNSTTLVAGEVAGIHQVKASVNGVKQIVAQNGFSVESSNPAVVSYNSTSGLFKAESAGTATITIKVGTVSKQVTFNVVNKARELTKVVANPSTVNAVKGYTKGVELKTFDQYGDPISVATGDVTEVVPVAADGTTPVVTAASVDVVTSTAGSIGVNTVTVDADEVGKGTVYFKDATTSKVIGSMLVNVTEVNNVGSQKLEVVKVAGESEDNALDILADNTVTYKLANYNTSGIYRDDQVLTNYKLEVVDGTVATVQFHDGTAVTGTPTAGAAVNESITGVLGDVRFVVTGKKAGKTDILLKKADNTVAGKITITVSNDPIKISGVNWKQLSTVDYVDKTISYKDALTITSSNAGDLVSNITLSKATPYKVRISEGAASGDVAGDVGKIYLDKNADGLLTAGEELGWLELTMTSDSVLANSITDAITGYTTAPTDKGTLIFKVYVDANGDSSYDANEAVSSTSVKLAVK